MSILSPYLKSPLTDMTGVVTSHQWGNSQCKELEMKTLDCLEAYGLDRGIKKCDELIKDFGECSTKRKQIERINIMRMERHRQHFAGERSKEDKYSKNPPPPDSF